MGPHEILHGKKKGSCEVKKKFKIATSAEALFMVKLDL